MTSSCNFIIYVDVAQDIQAKQYTPGSLFHGCRDGQDEERAKKLFSLAFFFFC
jgi:hypothetical protein